MKIELNKISKSYQSDSIKQIVLDEISMTINTGDTIAIVGPSGSGKTTLLNIIGTLDLPDIGTVNFDGTNVNSMNEASLAKLRNNKIGFVFQQHYLLPQLTLLENVLVPVIPKKNKVKKNVVHERAMDLINYVGLAEHINKYPGQMSGGECQRASVIRALINEPELILTDEPTGALDNDSALKLGELLLDIKSWYSVAMVLVTHSMELAERMNTVYRLHSGKLINQK